MEKEGKDLKSLGSGATHYNLDNPSPDILETFENKFQEHNYLVTLSQIRDEFSSLCPKTGQPDQAKIEVIYIPDKKMIESKSYKLYLFSYRNHGSFHETIINQIANDLNGVLEPKYVRVFGDFAHRGGIAIKPLVEKWKKEISTQEICEITRLINMWDIKR